MSSEPQTSNESGFTPKREIVPNPSTIAQQYDAYANEVASEFSGEISEAQSKVASAKTANGFFAKRRAFSDEKVGIDEKHNKFAQGVAAQAKLVETELHTLLQKEKQLEKGALAKAQKRVEAQAAAIQEEIAELTELRDVLSDVIEAGIEIPNIDLDGDGDVDADDAAVLDFDGNGVLDTNDIEALDERIEGLKTKVAEDPILRLLSKQVENIHAGVDARKAKIEQAQEKLAEDKQQWKAELVETKEKIVTERSKAVVSAKTEFNEVAGKRNEAVLDVKKQKEAEVEAEKADLAEYKANVSASKAERRSNTLTGTYNAAVEAWKTIKTTISEAFTKKTAGEEANEELLAKRRAQIEGSSTPKLGGPS